MKVVLIAAVSADGFISRGSSELIDWTGTEDKKLFAHVTKRAGVLVMGGNTYRTIGHALPGRRNIIYSRSPIEQEGIETTRETPAELLVRLEREGHAEVAIGGGAAIYGMFLAANVVDEVYLTIEPVIFGEGIKLANQQLATQMELIETRALSANEILMHYRVRK